MGSCNSVPIKNFTQILMYDVPTNLCACALIDLFVYAFACWFVFIICVLRLYLMVRLLVMLAYCFTHFLKTILFILTGVQRCSFTQLQVCLWIYMFVSISILTYKLINAVINSIDISIYLLMDSMHLFDYFFTDLRINYFIDLRGYIIVYILHSISNAMYCTC